MNNETDKSSLKRARTNAERINGINRAMLTINSILLIQSVFACLSVALLASVMANLSIVGFSFVIVIAVAVAIALYSALSTAVQVSIGHLLRLMSEPARLRDQRTGRFIPYKPPTNGDRRAFFMYEE